MSNREGTSRTDNSSIEKFRRSPFKIGEKPVSVSLDDLQNAISTGLNNTNLSSRALKDYADMISNYFQSNIEELALGKKEQFDKHKKAVHDTFEEYKCASRIYREDTPTKEQNFKDVTQRHLHLVQKIEGQNRI
jgi:hypothetical protein